MTRPLIVPIVIATVIAVSCAEDNGNHAPETAAGIETQSGLAEVQGGRLYYESAGSGDAVVLVHGNAGDRRHWDAQFSALAIDYRVIRYDVRGFGESSLPEEDRPYSDHEDLATLLDHLGITAAHVVGFSMGSGIAVDSPIPIGRDRSPLSVPGCLGIRHRPRKACSKISLESALRWRTGARRAAQRDPGAHVDSGGRA